MSTREEMSRPGGYYYNEEKDVVHYVCRPSIFGDQGMFHRGDFLTEDSPAIVTFDLKHPPEGMVDLKDQSLKFYSLELYLKVVKSITALMRVHGDNHEVFGPPGHQAFIMDFKRSLTLAMNIENAKVLHATGKLQAGVSIYGNIVDEGTVVTYSRLMEYLNEMVERYTGTLSEKIRSAVIRQWQNAIHEDVVLCSSHFDRGSTDYDGMLTVATVAEYLKVSKTSIGRYRNGEIPAGYAPFPKPDKYHGRSPLWMKSTMAAWAASKR